MIDGFWKVSRGEKLFWLLTSQGFLGEEVFVRMQGRGRGAVGGKIGLWGVCIILLRSLDFIL